MRRKHKNCIFKLQKEHIWFGFSLNYILFNNINLSLILPTWIPSLLKKLDLSYKFLVSYGGNYFLSFKKNNAESDEILKLGYNQLSFNFYYQSLPDITFGNSD